MIDSLRLPVSVPMTTRDTPVACLPTLLNSSVVLWSLQTRLFLLLFRAERLPEPV
jgi:hypothetical protein